MMTVEQAEVMEQYVNGHLQNQQKYQDNPNKRIQNTRNFYMAVLHVSIQIVLFVRLFFPFYKPPLIYCSINLACSTVIILIPVVMKRNRTSCFFVSFLSRIYVTSYNIRDHTKVSEF